MPAKRSSSEDALMPSTTPPPRPPMSTSSLSGSMKPFAVRAPSPSVKPPVLASDILRDEVAPRQPAKRALRVALVAFAATFATGALAARGFLGPVHIAGALAPRSRPRRRSSPCSRRSSRSGTRRARSSPRSPAACRSRPPRIAAGPMAALGAPSPGEAGSGVTRVAAYVTLATVLPAALVFRARYRAYRGARTLLAIALVLSLPALALLGASALGAGADVVTRVLSWTALAAAAASTLGFMGPETTAGCMQWAAILVGAVVARPAWRAVEAAWAGHDAPMLASTAAAVGELVATTLVTFALFQLVAAAFADRARATTDVHQVVGAGVTDPAPQDD